MLLHPVPPVPELRTRAAKRVEWWRKGPGRHAVAVFVAAAGLSVFVHTIVWLYSFNVFCMSGFDQVCTTRLDWTTWTVATILLYVNVWSLATLIVEKAQRRRVRRLAKEIDGRLAAIPERDEPTRVAALDELRRRATDREAEEPRARFHAQIYAWCRNLVIPASVVPYLTLNLQERLATTLPAVAVIATAQAWTVWRLTKHARRMRGAADELAEQWNADVSAVEARARGEPHAAIKFRPWALPAAPAPAAKH